MGQEVRSEYKIRTPAGYGQTKSTEEPVRKRHDTGSLRFVVTKTGQTTGPATIQGRLWVTDLVSGDHLSDQTDGGAGSVKVQAPAKLKINYTLISQSSVTIGQEEDWTVRLNLSNNGESDLMIDTSRIKSYRSEEHTSELQSHSFISYAVFCLKKKKTTTLSTPSSPYL